MSSYFIMQMNTCQKGLSYNRRNTQPSQNNNEVRPFNYDSINSFSQVAPTYSGSSNTNFEDGCPARMSDGRFLASNYSSNDITDQIKRLNGITNTNELRTFLQNNANAIINSEREHLLRENTCNPQSGCSKGWYDLHSAYGNDWSNLGNFAPFN